MSIDWITVAAQIANFLVLVWLLKRFLYRPILDGIDAREAEITQRMQDAVHARKQAKVQEQEYHDKLQALNLAQAEMTETIRKKAEQQRDVLLAKAREQLEEERKSWARHLDEETGKYTTKMHRAGAVALLALTRKALTDLADETFEERMAHHLATRIAPMASDLGRASGQAGQAVVTSHRPLQQAGQHALQAELERLFPDVSVHFDTDDDQSPGLVLRIGGAQVAWTVETYLDDLEGMIDAQLASGPGVKVPPDDH
jgi:F-type H+-transporting ATPase subunit b